MLTVLTQIPPFVSGSRQWTLASIILRVARAERLHNFASSEFSDVSSSSAARDARARQDWCVSPIKAKGEQPILTYSQRIGMSRHMAARTTVRLPKGLLDRAKRKAAAEGRTLTSLIEDGLRLMVGGERKAAKGKRVLPPISKATGGPMPGIDLTDLSALQEIEDLDYVERMRRFK